MAQIQTQSQAETDDRRKAVRPRLAHHLTPTKRRRLALWLAAKAAERVNDTEATRVAQES